MEEPWKERLIKWKIARNWVEKFLWGKEDYEEKDDMDTSQAQNVETEVVEPKKVVRFKQNVEEDFCQPHPPPVGGQRTISTPRPPPPPPPPPPSATAPPWPALTPPS